jgi:AAA ATPase domain
VNTASPFRPGSASQPPVLAGREHLINLVRTATSTAGNRRESFQVLYGPRGVGKTCLLDRYADIVTDRGWATVRHEARSPGDPIGAILDRLREAEGLTKKLTRQLVELRERWGDESQSLNLGVYRREMRRQRKEPIPVAEQFADAVVAVATELTSKRRGLMIVVDEVQEVHSDELGAFGPVIQQLQRRADLTAMIVFGGLPNTPQLVTQAVTYGERMAFHAIDNLDEAATAHALAQPAADAGRPFDADALDRLVGVTEGYPFFVQLYGDYSWQQSGGASTINIGHVEAGVNLAQNDSSRGIYLARWNKLPAAQQRYLAAMATLSTINPVGTGDIARALGKPIQSLSDTRNELLEAGVLTAPRQGHVASSLPGFLAYVAAVADES